MMGSLLTALAYCVRGLAKSAGNFLDMWAREGPGEGVSVAAPKTYVIDFRFLLD